MALEQSLKIALKEWAIVCRALEQGRQMVLLRKGGISEAGDGEFRVEHREFLLFPTYLHQNRNMLKPDVHDTYRQMTAEPDEIVLSGAAEVTDIVRLSSRQQMDAIDDEHVWTESLIDMRFNYRPENPLYLLLVRAYRLSEPQTIVNTPAYAGCKSWVPLDETINTWGGSASLDDESYDRRRRDILKRVAS